MSNAVLSMTGFGRSLQRQEGLSLEVEIRSVNHRFLDISIKTPRIYNQFDTDIRKLLSTHLGRGRVEVFVTRRATDASSVAVNFNADMYARLRQIYAQVIPEESARGSEVTIALNLLSRREVLEVIEDPVSGTDSEREFLLKTISLALSDLHSMRVLEGEHLKSDLLSRLETLKLLHGKLEQCVQRTPIDYRERLSSRLQKLGPDVAVDPVRLAAEVALMCDRIDTTEELVRLTSHFEQVAQALQAGQGCGRRLDFLIQEMGREFNTITSKAQDAAVQHLVIDAKAELERMKEQVQNVE